jgi:methylenetetrahydrofolate dehydrogenase (NADP+)/methenyltetrahydrofolate cyclohydrolase
VPGGVGPMTVTMLIENTLRSAERTLSMRQTDDYQEWEAPLLKGH